MIEPDERLVERTLGGDVAAYGVLVGRYERSVRSVALAFVPDVHASEDIAQESFVAAYRDLRNLREGGKFGPWLMQIARRTAGRYIETRRRSPMTVALSDDPVSSGSDKSRSMSEDPRTERLLASIERLPENERLVVAMRYFDGHGSEEIAAMTGRPVGTVTKQLSRAYERLRRWLAEPEEGRHERS